MTRYGQTLTWGPLSAPAFFTGEPQSYSLRDAVTKQLIQGAAADNIAMALHSRKGELNFEAKVTSASTDFLDLSSGAGIAVSTLGTGVAGVLLATRAVEKWKLLQPKTASVQANWYPAMTQASPTLAGITNSAFTPSQSGMTIVTPGASIIYSTYGLTQAKGVLHELTLTQMLQITDDEPSPAGDILGATAHGYERTINLLLMAMIASTTNPMTDYPAVGSTLVIGSGTSMMSNYLITSSGPEMEMEKAMMYSVEAAWIPPFAS